MDAGAFFNRPYGLWAKEVFDRHTASTQMALKKVKSIFDPNNVLNQKGRRKEWIKKNTKK